MSTMAQAEERQKQALELHLAGATFDAIATILGYASKSGAHKAVHTALAARGQPTSADMISTELARLDAMLSGLWPKARRGDVLAVDRVLKISERRAAWLALAPLEVTKETTVLDELESRRAGRGAAPAGGAGSERRRR